VLFVFGQPTPNSIVLEGSLASRWHDRATSVEGDRALLMQIRPGSRSAVGTDDARKIVSALA
jgi:hypothetical protein